MLYDMSLTYGRHIVHRVTDCFICAALGAKHKDSLHAAMCEVKVESRTRVEEHGRTVLYEKIYRGVPTQGGGLRLLAYYERRIPLARMQMELRAAGHEKEWKGAA